MNDPFYKKLKSPELDDAINDLENLSEEVKHEYNVLLTKYDTNDLQHKILLMLLARVCKYFDAYLLLIKEGYGEPGSNLIRSIFESILWMRWIIISEDNAQKYFDLSKGELIRIALTNIGNGYFKPKNVPDTEAFKSLLKDESQNYKLPNWTELAKTTNMMKHYNLFYKYLATISHGTFMFLGERIVDLKISPDPDDKNILPFIVLANNFTRDCMLVTKIWILENKIREIPLIKL
ncbi:MAG: hypothetical protein FD143_2872 [Ignavibacteria bacterium]|nr:MAG: hypothetical protein FD143_2872 [Ignavibacteria bacterium]